jgi:photosystem II stability/assembly factor-like uncharacterized protein
MIKYNKWPYLLKPLSSHFRFLTYFDFKNLFAMKNKNKLKELFADIIFYLSILSFIIGFSFTDSPPPSGWYQQFMPDLNGRQLKDIYFIDTLTGWAVTSASGQSTDTIYVLKTTNAGDNWAVLYRHIGQWYEGTQGYYRIHFLNQNTGYTCDVVTGFAKTTDGGMSWTYLKTNNDYEDMSILNTDTLWITSLNPLTGGVFRTTNGGVNWTVQYSAGTANPDHIYMLNGQTGFISIQGMSGMRKTTNSGINWLQVNNRNGFMDMKFINDLTGWKTANSSDSIHKTTDGGITWTKQLLPTGSNFAYSAISRFAYVSRFGDTLWGTNGQIFYYPPTRYRGILYRTTNGGQNWLYQIPDTSFQIPLYFLGQFTDRYHGWAWDYWNVPTGIHTTTGGDTTFITGIERSNEQVPKVFKLYQNYPNPFNPTTKIRYQITTNKYVTLKVYDVLGKEIISLVNKKQNAGTYEVEFSGNGYSSGIYFYSLYIDGELSAARTMILLK